MDCWDSTVSRSRHMPNYAGNFTNTYHPSFSSSLLDAIYKSIDEQADPRQDHNVVVTRSKEVNQMGMYKKKLSVDVSTTAVRRPAVEERMVLRRSADYEASQHRRRTATAAASSSSDSSSGSGFYSSENESVSYRPAPVEKATPVARSAFLNPPFVRSREDKASTTAKKTKKQPASPGARFAGFLNSLLASAKTAKVVKQAKKVRLSSSSLSTAVEELPSPALSSASSRSCLSKSGGTAGGGAKRSVRFYPVSVIVDEDSRPCGQKSLLDPSPSPPPATKYLTEELKLHIMEKNRRVEEAADRILNRYQARTEILLRRESWASPAPEMAEEDHDSDDESDAASDISSDLFELKNLGTIGAGSGAGAGERYREELPVYETTNFVTNRAIAHGLIM